MVFPMNIWRAIIGLQEPFTNTWKPNTPSDTTDELSKPIFAEKLKEYML